MSNEIEIDDESKINNKIQNNCMIPNIKKNFTYSTNNYNKCILRKVCVVVSILVCICLGIILAFCFTPTYNVCLNSDLSNAQLKGAGKYKKGEEVTIYAEDLDGYSFDYWEYNGNNVSVNNSYTFLLTNKTQGNYTAVYTQNYNVTISTNLVDVTLSFVGVLKNGKEMILSAGNVYGYRFDHWEYNGLIVSTEQVYTFQLSNDTQGEYKAIYIELITITFNVDGVRLGDSYIVPKGTTLNDILSKITDANLVQKYTLENTCGFYNDIDLIDYIDPVTPLDCTKTIYTKMATLNDIDILNGEVTMCWYGVTNVVIPFMCNGVKVTRIGANAFYRQNISSVVMPAGIVDICDSSFRYCTQLSSIIIPKNVVKIGRFSFSDCLNLSSVIFADNTNWTNLNYNNTTNIDINPNSLMDPSVAAEYLRDSRSFFYWLKK